LQADKPDIIILPGDLTYADDYNADDRTGYQPRWDIWGRLTQFLFSGTILVPTIGACDQSATPARTVLALPQALARVHTLLPPRVKPAPILAALIETRACSDGSC